MTTLASDRKKKQISNRKRGNRKCSAKVNFDVTIPNTFSYTWEKNKDVPILIILLFTYTVKYMVWITAKSPSLEINMSN